MKRIAAFLTAALLLLSFCAAVAEDFDVGDIVVFGHYEQDGNRNTSDPIRWVVIDVDGDHLFLLSEKGLEKHRFHSSSNGTMWAKSELRDWLNNTFYKKAFNSAEQKAILKTTVEDTLEHTNRNWDSGNRYGDTVTDRVFLLSYKEMNKIVPSEFLLCEPSQYVVNQDIYTERVNGRRTCWYWLRTSAYRNNACVVDTQGAFDTCYIHHPYGVVRPALWVEADAVTKD